MTALLTLITLAAAVGWVLFWVYFCAYKSAITLWRKHPTGHVLMPGLGERFSISLSDHKLVQVVVNSITYDPYTQEFTGTFKEVHDDRD